MNSGQKIRDELELLLVFEYVYGNIGTTSGTMRIGRVGTSAMPQMATTIRIPVPETVYAHALPAIIRLGYLYPAATFSMDNGAIEAVVGDGVDVAVLSRDVRYVLYREKIYAETLEMRIALVRAVTRK